MESENAGRLNRAALGELIEEITVDAENESEQLWAFRQAFEDEIALPLGASVIGEPVVVTQLDFDGNERRGLIAKCRRADGRKYTMAASEVMFPHGTKAERYLAAYRMWMGLPPYHPKSAAILPAEPEPKAAGPILDLHSPLELAVLSVKGKTAPSRPLGSNTVVVFRTTRACNAVPGEIVLVRPVRQWRYGGVWNLSGEIQSRRLAAAELELVPLRLEKRWPWDPKKDYWLDEARPIASWAKAILDRGPREAFEMEQVLPGDDPEDVHSDPILEANDLMDSDPKRAREILMSLCLADLRCLDAHAHLGNSYFESSPRQAIRHYEAGFRIGELSLGKDFDGLLPWGCIDNRPFLRCMYGFGLCLWRIREFKAAYDIFKQILWLNPTDNQGVRMLIEDVRAKRPWVADQEY